MKPNEEDLRVARAEFRVLCDGQLVASACGPREDALREAQWYAFQYAQDGRVEIVETEG